MTIATPFAAPNGSTVPDPTGTAPPTTPTPAPVQAGAPPQIVPNRRRLDNHFPVLAFNIRTLGRPWFEVLLATDRTLFAPDNAGRRSPANFYASREHGGLLRADTEDVAYVVPASVLLRFVEARPRPAAIYYTVAGYPAPDVPPILSQPPETLVQTAPSVAIGADFAAHTVTAVLGIPTEKLRRIEAAQPLAPVTMSVELDDDGVPVSQSASWSSDDEEVAAVAAAAAAWAEGAGAHDLESAPGPAVATIPTDEAEARPAEPAEEHEIYRAPTPRVDPEYDDGYGALDDDGWEHEQESQSAVGAAEPAELPDDHDQVDEDLRRQASESRAQQAEYGDEAQGYGSAYATGEYDEEAQAAPAPLAPPAPAPLAPPTPPAPATAAPGNAPVPSTSAPFVGPALSAAAKVALLHKIGHRFETSRPQSYRMCERDVEFHTPSLPQYQRWHVGLTYGFFGFTQDSGSLGHLLERFKHADESTFHGIFGPHADELIAITTAHGPEGRHAPGGRSTRVQPVGGHDLWEDEWAHRFEAAGDVPAFQRAQDETAVAYFVDPMLPLARAFGMDTERALGMIVDRAGHQGVGGAMRWLLRAMSPLQADAVRQQALAALGFPGIREFQQAHGLHADGDFGPRTHIAVAEAVRALGHNSPVPFPTREQLMDALVAAAEREHVWWRRRPREMRIAPELGDAPLTWTETHGR